jgi:UDP-3-O-acyl-N-acetylglucosamine deacetylase
MHVLLLQVLNVELLLAALEACGVDNARIEVEGGHEIPVLDNSALAWCIEVQVRPASKPASCTSLTY